MHIKKNVCESLLGTLLNMPEKTKDGPKARQDLIHLKIREDIHGDSVKLKTDKRKKGINDHCPPHASV